MEKIFTENAFDAVMHFAAVAYVGESTSEPLRCSCLVCLNSSYDRSFVDSQGQICRYYHNITSNTLLVVKAMASRGVKTLIYSSTCATYGEPDMMPITETTPQVRFFCIKRYLVYVSWIANIWLSFRFPSIRMVRRRKWRKT